MRDRPDGMDRRTFLRGLGGAAVALPLLEAMGCSPAPSPSGRPGAAPAPLGRAVLGLGGLPKRLVIFYSANGTIPARWRPTGSESSFTLSPILAPLAPHKASLLILNGVDMLSTNFGPGDAHQKGMGHLFTGRELQDTALFGGGQGAAAGWADGISVDQQIAATIGQTTRFRSLELGVQVDANGVIGRLSYLGPAQPKAPENDPYAVFGRIFGDFSADPATLARLRAQRRSVLDAVQADATALQQRLGAADRQKLEAHLAAVRELESKLDAAGEPTSPACARPDLGAPIDVRDSANFPRVGQLQMDLLAMALACDLTRVGTIQWSRAGSPKIHTWLGITDLNHHQLSHRADSDTVAADKLVQINRFYAQQLAYLIDRLKALPEGDGTVFDNTVIVWVSELAKGNTHSRMDAPFVLAGSAGGFFRTGRFLTFAGDVPHNNLLVSLLQAFGLEATTFGNPAHCTGPIARLV